MKKLFIVSVAVLMLSIASFAHASEIDTDKDGLFDADETSLYHTDPVKADTDGDGYLDGYEIVHADSPLVAKKKLAEVDTDKDGLFDDVEIALKTNLINSDTDGDGYPDGVEVANGFNPLLGGRDRSLPRHVEVNLTTQQMNYFLADVKVGTVPVSTGLLGMETPTGEFAIMRKLPVYRYVGRGYDLPNTQWNLEFKRSFYLHGAYWHNQFGIRPMSHGCVNISTANAEKIYKFMDVGDKVVIAGKTPRKPLTATQKVAQR